MTRVQTLPSSRKSPTLAAALRNEDSFATTLAVILQDEFPPIKADPERGVEADPGWLGWSPATIRMEIFDEFQVEMSSGQMGRILAAQQLLTSDDFYHRLPRFIRICNQLSGYPFMPEVFDPADVMECAWGVIEGLILNPPEENEFFSEEIARYIGFMLDEEGFLSNPQCLSFAPRDGRIALGLDADAAGGLALMQSQLAASQEVDQLVQENLRDLFHQLSALRLTNGNTQGIAGRVRGVFQTLLNDKQRRQTV